jgi:hypothetical protein
MNVVEIDIQQKSSLEDMFFVNENSKNHDLFPVENPPNHIIASESSKTKPGISWKMFRSCHGELVGTTKR